MLDDDLLKDLDDKKALEKNKIVEINNDNHTTTMYDLKKIIPEKSKKPNLRKKKKSLIICFIITIIFLIIGIILYFYEIERKPKNKVKKPITVIKKDNYRYEDGILIFIDQNKKDIGQYECKFKDKDLCYITYFSNEDDFDETKYIFTNGLKVKFPSEIVNNQYVFIYDNAGKENGLISLYDMKEKKILNKFKLVKKIKDNMFILKNDKDKYGVISLDNYQEVIAFKYDYLGYLDGRENLVGIVNSHSFILDFQGKEITKSIIGEIKNYNDKYISATIDNKYLLIDYDGQIVIDANYDYIRFKDDVIGFLKGKKLYLYDNNLTKLNNAGIKLESSLTDPKITLANDYQIITREDSFTLDVTDNTVTVNSKDSQFIVNRQEARINLQLNYLSYYDGQLYIYSDEEKNTEIGSYKCNNKNVIDSKTTTLNNCFIASETKLLNRESASTNLGYLPIYNKRYAFIKDGDNIILWDLKLNKKLATYKNVDAGYYKKTIDIPFVNTANTLVMAKNINDSFGIVRIEANNVTGIISFKTNNLEIKYLKDKLLTKRKDGTYHLYEINGEEITENIEIKNEIVDFNGLYYEVKNNDEYMIYTKNGKIVPTGKKMLYIKMKDDFFVGINEEDEIGIYEYDGTKHTDSNSDSKIINTTNFENSYSLIINENEIIVNVYDLNDEISYTFIVIL